MSSLSSASATAIWERVIHPERGDLPPEAARFFLGLTFEPADLEQMHALAEKGQAGTLTVEEADALRNFRQIGLQLDLLRSKARLAMGRASSAP